jgi:hypothetical protein
LEKILLRRDLSQARLKNGDNIRGNVDYTILNDDFLILCASINVASEKDMMPNFTASNYPKRKTQMNRKKMERTFFKGLRHISNFHDRLFSVPNLHHGTM